MIINCKFTVVIINLINVPISFLNIQKYVKKVCEGLYFNLSILFISPNITKLSFIVLTKLNIFLWNINDNVIVMSLIQVDVK